MATHDVPGSNPANKDELSMGCWAEHDDGSLLFVDSTEGGVVVYEMFDMSKDPPVVYRDSMSEQDFKQFFSWAPDVGSKKKKGKGLFKGRQPQNEKWLWHDKTPFPWDRVLGTQDGPAFASASGLRTAAERVAESIRAKGQEVSKDQYGHKADQTMGRLNTILDKVDRALQELAR